jgi:hypothetical protein
MAEAGNTAADMSPDEIDQTIGPVVLDLVRMLVTAGRPPRQAMQDVRRNIDRIEAEFDKEERAGVGTG